MNKKNTEITIGIVSFIIITGMIYAIIGDYIFIFVIMFLVASFSIYLFSKNNIFAKIGGILIYEGIILKVLMPSKYRKQINKINSNKKHNKAIKKDA